MSLATFFLVLIVALPIGLACLFLLLGQDNQLRGCRVAAVTFAFLAGFNVFAADFLASIVEGRQRYELRENGDGSKTWQLVPVKQD